MVRVHFVCVYVLQRRRVSDFPLLPTKAGWKFVFGLGIVLLIIMPSKAGAIATATASHTKYLLNLYEHAMVHANRVRIAITLLVYEHQMRAVLDIFT